MTVLLILGGALIVALTAVHYLIPHLRPTVVFFGTAIGVFLAVYQLYAAARSEQEQVKHQQIDVAFSRYAEMWQKPGIQAAVRHMPDVMDSVRGKTAPDKQAYFGRHPEEANGTLAVLNMFDEMGRAVRSGYADGNAICALYAARDGQGPGARYYRMLEDWIDLRNRDLNRPAAFADYRYLYQTWFQSGCGER